MMNEHEHCCDEAANHQLPRAVASWIILIISTEECSSLMQNWMQIHCSTCSHIVNAMATQYPCSLNGIYCPHWPVQWSDCPCMCIPVHSPWLPRYINAVQTILVMLTKVGLFPDRPPPNSCFTLGNFSWRKIRIQTNIYMCVCVYKYVCVCVCIHLRIKLSMLPLFVIAKNWKHFWKV